MTGILEVIQEHGALCEIERIGQPWHGKVTHRIDPANAGKLERVLTTDVLVDGLPIVKVMGSNIDPVMQYLDHLYDFQVQGVGPVVTPAEDSALGMEWRSDAIVPSETGISPLIDNAGATWLRRYNQISLYSKAGTGGPDYIVSFAINKDQVIYLQAEHASSVFTVFYMRYNYPAYTPTIVTGLPVGFLSQNVKIIDAKNSGRTLLLGIKPPGAVSLTMVFELNFTGYGSLVFDPSAGTTVPAGLSATLSVIYGADLFYLYSPPTPDPSYDNSTTVTTGDNCANLEVGDIGHGVTTHTYDSKTVGQRLIGAFYDSSGTVVPVRMLIESFTSGMLTDTFEIVRADPYAYVCHDRNHVSIWNMTSRVRRWIESGGSSSGYIEHTETYSGRWSEDPDQPPIGNSGLSGNLSMPILGINLGYSGVSIGTGVETGFLGGVSAVGSGEIQGLYAVRVWGHQDFFALIGDVSTFGNIYGLTCAKTGPATAIPNAPAVIDFIAGTHVAFAHKGGMVPGMVLPVVAGKCGTLSTHYSVNFSYYYVMQIDYQYTAYNPRNGEVAVLHQYPVWFV